MADDIETLLERRRLQRRVRLWRLAAFGALVLAIALGVGRWAGGGKAAGDHIARVAIDGVITEDADRDALLEKLEGDAKVKAVLLRINSPGGTIHGAEALYKALRRLAAKKPVVAVMGSVAASGGYVAALGADRLIAGETSVTGSIGVIIQTAEVTALLDTLGIKAEAIKSSPLKASPNPLEPMTPEARAAAQAWLGDGYAWFKELVGARRGLSGTALDAVADGRVFTGRQALALRLIDGLGGEGEARDWLAAEKGLDRSLAVTTHEPDEDEDRPWRRLLRREIAAIARNLQWPEALILDVPAALWQPSQSGWQR